MNCATHNDVAAVAFCRTCGKPLCQSCTRDVRGVIYCESCLAARMEGSVPAAGSVPPSQAPFTPVGVPGYTPSPHMSTGPNPAVAGILGAIPFGIGAIYNGQYAKGLAHMFIFVMLIFGANHAGSLDWVFGLCIPFFILYQIIDAVRSAKAIQMGQPAPDPLGLTQAFGSDKIDTSKIPMGAVILIGLGVLFLLHTMGFWEFGLARFWPLLIVAVGAWMFYRSWERPGRLCSCARCRSRGLMGSGMVLLTGILFLLSTTDVAGLDRTWPAWILAVGVIQLIRSTASTAGHIGTIPPMPPSAPPPPPPDSEPGAPQPPTSGEVTNV